MRLTILQDREGGGKRSARDPRHVDTTTDVDHPEEHVDGVARSVPADCRAGELMA